MFGLILFVIVNIPASVVKPYQLFMRQNLIINNKSLNVISYTFSSSNQNIHKLLIIR